MQGLEVSGAVRLIYRSLGVKRLIVEPTHAHFQFLFIKIYLKFLKILLHVSVIRPSSGSF